MFTWKFNFDQNTWTCYNQKEKVVGWVSAHINETATKHTFFIYYDDGCGTTRIGQCPNLYNAQQFLEVKAYAG